MQPPSQLPAADIDRWLAEVLDQDGYPPLDDNHRRGVFGRFVHDVEAALVGEECGRVIRAGYLAMRSSAAGQGAPDANR